MTTSTERPTRKRFTLADAGREFWKHPSPWMIGAPFVAALTARIIVGDWQITDVLVPVVMLALFPFFEWSRSTRCLPGNTAHTTWTRAAFR
jgi:hypothetical protein